VSYRFRLRVKDGLSDNKGAVLYHHFCAVGVHGVCHYSVECGIVWTRIQMGAGGYSDMVRLYSDDLRRGRHYVRRCAVGLVVAKRLSRRKDTVRDHFRDVVPAAWFNDANAGYRLLGDGHGPQICADRRALFTC